MFFQVKGINNQGMGRFIIRLMHGEGDTPGNVRRYRQIPGGVEVEVSAGGGAGVTLKNVFPVRGCHP